MATFVKAVLPSGKGIKLEKLTTRQYRAVAERVSSKLGDSATTLQMTGRLSHEMLLAALRGVTYEPIAIVNDATGEPDVDAMLDAVADDKFWIRPTFEELILNDGSNSLETLLDDPADYLVAENLATGETLGGHAGALRGKVKREFVGR